jgi:hypothetical protein
MLANTQTELQNISKESVSFNQETAPELTSIQGVDQSLAEENCVPGKAGKGGRRIQID